MPKNVRFMAFFAIIRDYYMIKLFYTEFSTIFKLVSLNVLQYRSKQNA